MTHFPSFKDHDKVSLIFLVDLWSLKAQLDWLNLRRNFHLTKSGQKKTQWKFFHVKVCNFSEFFTSFPFCGKLNALEFFKTKSCQMLRFMEINLYIYGALLLYISFILFNASFPSNLSFKSTSPWNSFFQWPPTKKNRYEKKLQV